MKMKISYKIFFGFRLIIASALLAYAICAINRFSGLVVGLSNRQPSHVFEIIFWTLGPPIWFFAEYYLIDKETITPPPGTDKEKFLVMTKSYSDTASKIWAAVLAVLVFMYTK